MNKQEKKIMSVWTMLMRIFPQVVAISPWLFILNYILFVLNGVSFAASTLCMQILFDKVTNFAFDKGTLMGAVGALIIFFLVKISEEVFSGLANFIAETYDPKSIGKLSQMVNLKINRLDPISFENTEILEYINKSYVGIKFAINFMNTIMDVMLFYLPYFLFMGIYLFRLKPILAISLILVFLPVLISQVIRVKIFSKLEDNSSPLRRKSKYYEDCLVGREYLKETRVLGATPYFMNLLKESIIQMNNLKWKADLKTNLVELGMKMLSLVGYFSILWMLFNSLINREISVGAFAAVFASVDSMFSMMENVICGRLGYYARNFGKVQNYLKFLELPERSIDENAEENLIHGDITLANVWFKYPTSKYNALENINLTIHKGETVAIVGENGSGKSTLIRLITGVYLPGKGQVIHNKKSTKDFTSKYLFDGISGVFQKFQRYQLTFSQNIAISEMSIKSKDEEKIKFVVKQAGIQLNSDNFTCDYDTMLSREFDGIELSGGQWQKIAIARGLYRNHELIILDEPTSAIDPIEETKIYEDFANISRNKTTIIVTHRLGAIKLADRIAVMKDGKIIDIDNHDNLLRSCPLYMKMWESQAKYYIE